MIKQAIYTNRRGEYQYIKDVVPSSGEILVELDNGTPVSFKIGDGSTSYKDLELGGSIYYLDVTYKELSDKITNSELIPGKKYRLVDFQTVHVIQETDDINIGPVEPLILTAFNDNTLLPEAISEEFPEDIIYYNHDASVQAPQSGTTYGLSPRAENYTDGQTVISDITQMQQKGVITYRKDTIHNIELYYDWRAIRHRRWSIAIPSAGFKGGSYDYAAWSNSLTDIANEPVIYELYEENKIYDDLLVFFDERSPNTVVSVSIPSLNINTVTSTSQSSTSTFIGSSDRDTYIEFTIGEIFYEIYIPTEGNTVFTEGEDAYLELVDIYDEQEALISTEVTLIEPYTVTSTTNVISNPNIVFLGKGTTPSINSITFTGVSNNATFLVDEEITNLQLSNISRSLLSFSVLAENSSFNNVDNSIIDSTKFIGNYEISLKDCVIGDKISMKECSFILESVKLYRFSDKSKYSQLNHDNYEDYHRWNAYHLKGFTLIKPIGMSIQDVSIYGSTISAGGDTIDLEFNLNNPSDINVSNPIEITNKNIVLGQEGLFTIDKTGIPEAVNLNDAEALFTRELLLDGGASNGVDIINNAPKYPFQIKAIGNNLELNFNYVLPEEETIEYSNGRFQYDSFDIVINNALSEIQITKNNKNRTIRITTTGTGDRVELNSSEILLEGEQVTLILWAKTNTSDTLQLDLSAVGGAYNMSAPIEVSNVGDVINLKKIGGEYLVKIY